MTIRTHARYLDPQVTGGDSAPGSVGTAQNMLAAGMAGLGGVTEPPSMPRPLSQGNEPPKPGTPPPHPDLAKPPVGPNDPPRPDSLYVPRDQWTSYQKEVQDLRAFKADADAREEAKHQENLRLMAEKGQALEALKLQKDRYDKQLNDAVTGARAIESEWLAEAVSNEVTKALNGRNFVGSKPERTAEHVRKLLEAEIEAVRDPSTGKRIVRDKSQMRPASEYLKELLDSEDFSIYFAAKTRGGSGTDGARPAGANAADPKNPNAAFAEAYRARLNAAKTGNFGQ